MEHKMTPDDLLTLLMDLGEETQLIYVNMTETREATKCPPYQINLREKLINNGWRHMEIEEELLGEEILTKNGSSLTLIEYSIDFADYIIISKGKAYVIKCYDRCVFKEKMLSMELSTEVKKLKQLVEIDRITVIILLIGSELEDTLTNGVDVYSEVLTALVKKGMQVMSFCSPKDPSELIYNFLGDK